MTFVRWFTFGFVTSRVLGRRQARRARSLAPPRQVPLPPIRFWPAAGTMLGVLVALALLAAISPR